MPANKNQHYVPRCLLKPFSLNGDGLAINLYNIGSDNFVSLAPTKGQCSRDYFYGRDLQIERSLQELEGKFSNISKKIVSEAPDISPDDLNFLRIFAYLQMCRTEIAVKRRTQAHLGMHEIFYRGFPNNGLEPPNTESAVMVASAMKMWAETVDRICDLEITILRNNTRRNFVLSDDPAVLTNRLHIQRLGDSSFGLISAGTQLMMPLSPRFALLCYDRDTYAAPNKHHHTINLNKEVDILALNELQYISCDRNIYFSCWEERDYIKQEFSQVATRRPETWFRYWIGVLIKEDESGEFYRRATESEVASKATKVVSLSPVYPNPSRWLRELIYRPRIFAYSNDSAVGLVRRGQVTALNSREPFRREEVKFRSISSHWGPETEYLRKG